LIASLDKKRFGDHITPHQSGGAECLSALLQATAPENGRKFGVLKIHPSDVHDVRQLPMRPPFVMEF
jgi:hypothetical protein